MSFSTFLKGFLRGGGVPDIGQTFYVVDSDYRTQAQGWSKADATGPLDIYAQRNSGYVFRTGDYSSDAACLQAAIDAMVDYRGDTLFLTPGNYSLATALSINVPNARWLGPQVSDPRTCRTTITDAVGSALAMTSAATGMEMAYLRFVPTTATPIWTVAAGANNGHFHHFFYDTNGIAASTATRFLVAAGNTFDYWKFSNFYFLTDAAQGAVVEIDDVFRGIWIQDFEHDHEAGTLAVALLMVDGAGTGPITIERGSGNVSGGGAVTALVGLTDAGIDTQWISVRDFRGSIGYCAASGLVSLSAGGGATAEAAEVGLAACYLDVVSGGAGGAGTAYTA